MIPSPITVGIFEIRLLQGFIKSAICVQTINFVVIINRRAIGRNCSIWVQSHLRYILNLDDFSLNLLTLLALSLGRFLDKFYTNGYFAGSIKPTSGLIESKCSNFPAATSLFFQFYCCTTILTDSRHWRVLF